MKNNDLKVIFAHVELEQVRVAHGEGLGIDFHNGIDTWTKMEVVFRQQIKYLKENKKKSINHSLRLKSD